MLIDFSVENFRSFKDRQMITFEPDRKVKGLEDYYIMEVPDRVAGKKPIKLLKIGMIYGANASGKSNLLKALMFLGWEIIKSKKDKNQPLDFEPFLFDAETPSKSSYMEVNLIANQTRYNYKLEFTKDAIINEELNYYKYYTAKKANNIFKRTTDIDKQLSKIKFDNDILIEDIVVKQLELNTLWNETVLVGFNKTNADIDHLTNFVNWFRNYLDNSIVPRDNFVSAKTLMDLSQNIVDKKSLIGILKNADFNIEDIEIESKTEEKEIRPGVNDEIRLVKKRTTVLTNAFHKVGVSLYPLPFKEESDGTKRFFGMAGVLLNLVQKSMLAPIDELESSLHPDLYEAFILAFLKNAEYSQLLFTTHNREFLMNKFSNNENNELRKIYRDDAVWITNKREDASTELYSISDCENGSDVYNTLIVGKYGGTPNVSNDLMF